jgi:hypothetical protein
VASYQKDDLCAKAAPPSHAPSLKGPVFVTSTRVFVYIRRMILQRSSYLMPYLSFVVAVHHQRKFPAFESEGNIWDDIGH